MGDRVAAVVLAHNRPELLAACVASIRPQVDLTLVFDNASAPPLEPVDGATIWRIPDQPPNIAKMWNTALDLLASGYDDPPFVAFLCDDTTVPDGWVHAVTEAMKATGAAAGCSNPWGHQHPPRMKHEPDGDIMGRMPGWAFILDTTRQLRADESMHWWWVDTSLDWEARQHGGLVMIGGYPVPNHRPGEFTNSVPGLGERAGMDRQAFIARWGWAPW